MRQIHALTPGDHFSPRTGSAIPTVVHGLSRHAAQRPAVLVAAGTYPDRYDSADVIEYPLEVSMHSATRRIRVRDALAGRLGRPRPWMTSVLGQLLVEQESWEPSLVIAHNAVQLVPLVADRHAAVVHAHNTLLGSYSMREAARVLDGVHRFICVSQWLAEVTRDRLPRRLGERVRVVTNGVDAAAFAALPRVPRAGALRVAFLGRVLPWKGPHVLLRALERLQREDIEVSVIGSAGFDRNAPLTAYEEELRRLGARLPGEVSFVPFEDRASVIHRLASVDVCVVPSVGPEPFGLVALEAMAAGAVVVASESGGLPEAVGSAGVIVAPGDVDALAQALEYLADEEGDLTRLGSRGRHWAHRRDWSVVAEEYARALA